ncbi:yojK [Symbiodinium sp. CCMP2592]|nr:yojK [Symbiodinium sp. CCMP2592]
MALNAILWAPIQAYCREEPTATAVTYLDDRNVVVHDHAQLVRTLQFWMRWAGRLGLEENVGKQKFLPRGSAAAQEVDQSRTVAVVHTLRILGVDFRTRIDGKNRPTYQDRLNEARQRLGRIGCLPVSFLAKCQFLRQLVLPVAVWGTWFVHGAAGTWKQLQQRLLGVLYGGRSPASPDLRALMQGHSLDFQFMADYQTISMWAKLVQLGRARWQPGAMRGTWQYAVAARLKSMGWHLQLDGSWTHQAIPRRCITWARNLQTERIKHLLREAWRFERFEAWKASSRLDAVAAANPTFQAARVKQAWQLWNATCAHGRAVLTAAVVSPARLQANKSGAAVQWCPFCKEGYAPTWDHCAWSCAHFGASRPALPGDGMQRRTGWPVAARTKAQNLRVLDHLATVRKSLVAYRCL